MLSFEALGTLAQIDAMVGVGDEIVVLVGIRHWFWWHWCSGIPKTVGFELWTMICVERAVLFV